MDASNSNAEPKPMRAKIGGWTLISFLVAVLPAATSNPPAALHGSVTLFVPTFPCRTVAPSSPSCSSGRTRLPMPARGSLSRRFFVYKSDRNKLPCLFSSVTPGRVAPLDEEPEEGHGPQVYATHQEDAIHCGVHRIAFLRAAFGNHDDVINVPIVKAVPFQADLELTNEKELRGKIVLVQRGSSSGATCSFVDKAVRVEGAGAVGMVVVNTDDSMISPGDSAREGGCVNIPVVGIRSSDLALLADCEEDQRVSLTYKPISVLTTEQRKHLRALSSLWRKEDELPEMEVDESVASEQVLASVDGLLHRHELVLLRIAADGEGSQMVSLQAFEDVFDVATVLADNLGATVVHITAKTILLYREGTNEEVKENKICLPQDGEKSELQMDLGELVGVEMLGFDFQK